MSDALRDVRTSAGELIWAAVFVAVDLKFQTSASGDVQRAVQEGLLPEIPMVYEFDVVPDEIGAVLFVMAFARLASIAGAIDGARGLARWFGFLVVAAVTLLVTSIDEHFVRTRGQAAETALFGAGILHLVAMFAAPAAMAGLCSRLGLTRATVWWMRTLAVFAWIFVLVAGTLLLAWLNGGVHGGPTWLVLPLVLAILLAAGVAWIGSCTVTRREIDDGTTTHEPFEDAADFEPAEGQA